MSAPVSKDMRVNYNVYVQNSNRKGMAHTDYDTFVNNYVASLKEQLKLSFRRENKLSRALQGIMQEPQGCPMCDAGVLRNPEKGHWPECPYLIAKEALEKEQ